MFPASPPAIHAPRQIDEPTVEPAEYELADPIDAALAGRPTPSRSYECADTLADVVRHLARG